MKVGVDSGESSEYCWNSSIVGPAEQLPVGLLFPNQGCEYVGMLQGDISSEPAAGLLARANILQRAHL